MIESELGQRPRFVAYPSGIYDDQVSALFASDNYWGGITTRQGIWHSSDKTLRDRAPARSQHDDHRGIGRIVGVGR